MVQAFSFGLTLMFLWPVYDESPQPERLWQSPAKWHEGAAARLSQDLRHHKQSSQAHMGLLVISAQGVEFQSVTGAVRRWPYGEIQSMDVLSRRLVLKSYENRGWFRPGEREFRFDLDVPIPPEIASVLAGHIAKPGRNGDPQTNRVAFDTIAARHVTRLGGSNGIVKFTDNGVDYLSDAANDSRSWRWSDIQTLANPDAYRLRVIGYRETFDFKLKQPLSRAVFDRLWDSVYARDLKGMRMSSGKEDK